MLVKRSLDIRYSEITPKHLYLNRRTFLAGLPLAGAALVGGKALAENKLNGITKSAFSTTEKVTPYNDVTHYNNYYEFGTRKEQPASLAQKLKTSPWTVKLEGAVNKPQVFDIDAIMKLAPLEERIYRHRCVEAWSIVVPSSRRRKPSSWPSRRCLSPESCSRKARRASRFLMWKACAWMRPCTR
jgi:sulfoxide reductase catalytic subunit YedY